MQEFNEGDLVEAVKGEAFMRARLVKDGLSLRLDVSPYFLPTTDILIKDGYTLTVIEKASPKLPTEPGAYASGRSIAILNESGEWRDDYGNRLSIGTRGVQGTVYNPLTRLEPASVTAKRVAEDFVAAILAKHDEKMGNTYSLHVSTLMEIAATFGVEA